MALAEQAIGSGESWMRVLGAPPVGSDLKSWRRHAATVAAYRDRYGIVGGRPLGIGQPTSDAQQADAARARAALEAAGRIANHKNDATREHRPNVNAGLSAVSLRF